MKSIYLFTVMLAFSNGFYATSLLTMTLLITESKNPKPISHGHLRSKNAQRKNLLLQPLVPVVAQLSTLKTLSLFWYQQTS